MKAYEDYSLLLLPNSGAPNSEEKNRDDEDEDSSNFRNDYVFKIPIFVMIVF